MQRVIEPMNTKKNILILYDHHEIHVKTIADYLESFHRFSRHNVSYVSSFAKCHFDLDYFDAVVLHYSVRVCHAGPLSASFAQALKKYQGLKVLFMSGYAPESLRQMQNLPQEVELVNKPLNRSELAEKLHRALALGKAA